MYACLLYKLLHLVHIVVEALLNGFAEIQLVKVRQQGNQRYDPHVL